MAGATQSVPAAADVGMSGFERPHGRVGKTACLRGDPAATGAARALAPEIAMPVATC